MLHKCVKCTRLRAETAHQLMGSLPSYRVKPDRAFFHTGVDYAGPIAIKPTIRRRHPVTEKSYICIFICCVTKVIHIELVGSLSTQAFVAAMRRFVSRRGLPRLMYSDCGSNFVGAQSELRDLHAVLVSSKHNELVASALSQEGIEWHLNPPAAPHFGGLWEAGVKSIKFHLRRTIGLAVLTYEELSTLLTQVEACLNSRPLCPLSNDISELGFLTPAHFLIGESLLTVPDPSLVHLSLSKLSRWQLIQRTLQQFWKRWSREYLSRLQQRPKWMIIHENLVAGDLVILKEPNVSPLQWPMGRVIEIHPGRDNLTRVVTLQTCKGIVKRPIVKCCKLPVDTSPIEPVTPNIQPD